jgi:hypothetical protein
MDKKLAKEFREHWAAVATVEAAEQRAASIGLRWLQLNSLPQLATELGLLSAEPDEEDHVVHLRWAKLKQGQA